MKLVYLIALFISIPLYLFGQTKSELIGTWKVHQVKLSQEIQVEGEAKQNVNMVIDAFSHSVFHFKSDGKFDFQVDIADLKIENGYWKYDPATNYVSVDNWDDRNKVGSGGLMNFYVKKDRMGRTLFLIEETPLIFIVEKMD